MHFQPWKAKDESGAGTSLCVDWSNEEHLAEVEKSLEPR